MTKTALVTGGAKRLGRSVALGLAGKGYDIALHFGGSKTEAMDTLAAIRALGRQAEMFQADLSDATAVDTLVPQITNQMGPLSCLVNNAAHFQLDTIDTLDRASWTAHMETNLWAPLALSQAFAKQLPADTDGCIINMLDERVWHLTPYFISYTASKSALWTLTQTLAMALAPNIRVNGIGPGPTIPAPKQTQEHFDRLVDQTPLRTTPNLDEFVAAIGFILEAKSMTGQMIALDGGRHLNWGPASDASIKGSGL